MELSWLPTVSEFKTFKVWSPLTVAQPNRPRDDTSTDFQEGLPECDGFDAIWVAVDQLSMMQHCIPCRTTIDASGSAKLFTEEVVHLDGLPLTIVSDRGQQFAMIFWGQICCLLGIDHRFSTASHPRTDGQTERMNATLEQYLKVFVNHQRGDLVKWLRNAEFTANHVTLDRMKCTPFFTVQPGDPRMTFSGESTI